VKQQGSTTQHICVATMEATMEVNSQLLDMSREVIGPEMIRTFKGAVRNIAQEENGGKTPVIESLV
jgi:hypothetical protein